MARTTMNRREFREVLQEMTERVSNVAGRDMQRALDMPRQDSLDLGFTPITHTELDSQFEDLQRDIERQIIDASRLPSLLVLPRASEREVPAGPPPVEEYRTFEVHGELYDADTREEVPIGDILDERFARGVRDIQEQEDVRALSALSSRFEDPDPRPTRSHQRRTSYTAPEPTPARDTSGPSFELGQRIIDMS